MPIIKEDRLKKRLEIRKEQVELKDVILCKLRDKIKNGYIPKNAKEFADVLRIVSEYQKLVGAMEECQEILEKLTEEVPMTMEKFGVECQGDHGAGKDYMVKGLIYGSHYEFLISFITSGLSSFTSSRLSSSTLKLSEMYS